MSSNLSNVDKKTLTNLANVSNDSVDIKFSDKNLQKNSDSISMDINNSIYVDTNDDLVNDTNLQVKKTVVKYD